MVRPRADNYEQRRAEILDAAAEMFAEKGFDGASLFQIARKCGVSKALVYHYYQSKEALLYSMLSAHCNLLVETANQAVTTCTEPEAKLKALIRQLMGLYMRSRNVHVTLLNSLHVLSPEEQNEIKTLEKEVVKTIQDILQELKPGLSSHTRTSLSMYLMGAINWTYTWFRAEGPISHLDYADLATSAFLHGIHSQELN